MTPHPDDACPPRPTSPCIQVCRIDPRTGWCVGCRRTLAEIAAWPTLASAAREEVWSQLQRRAVPSSAAAAPRVDTNGDLP